jgi:hypothetical protein
MELTSTFEPEQYAEGLESWDIVALTRLTPVLATAFGDVILHGPDGFSFLDIEAGTLTQIWATQGDLLADLNSPAGQAYYLRAELVAEAAERFGMPSETQVYSFRQSLILGGTESIDNVDLAEFSVALNIAGQIHAQIRKLPRGTRISAITIE